MSFTFDTQDSESDLYDTDHQYDEQSSPEWYSNDSNVSVTDDRSPDYPNDSLTKEIEKEFDQMLPTTITHIVTFENTLDYKTAFHLLDVTYPSDIASDNNSKYKKKGEVYSTSLSSSTLHRGDIISVRYKGKYRGLPGKSFRNAVIIDIVTKRKLLSLKLNSGGLQTCGSLSDGMILEASKYMVDHLNRIQNLLDKIHTNPEVTRRTADWVRQVTRGEEFAILNDTPYVVDLGLVKEWRKEKDITKTLDYMNNTMTVQADGTFTLDLNPSNQTGQISEEQKQQMVTMLNNCMITNKIVIPADYHNPPAGVDKEIALFLIKLSLDFHRYDHYLRHINYILSIREIMKGRISLGQIMKSMVNYNYQLPYNIDRSKLRDQVNGKDQFIALFDPNVDHGVSIILPGIIPEHLRNRIRKRNDDGSVKFIVYKKGTITQSGPCEDYCRNAYIRLMRIIYPASDQIANYKKPLQIQYYSLEEQKKLAQLIEEKRREDQEMTEWLASKTTSVNDTNISITMEEDDTEGDIIEITQQLPYVQIGQTNNYPWHQSTQFQGDDSSLNIQLSDYEYTVPGESAGKVVGDFFVLPSGLQVPILAT